jgi:hypothetical protein
MKSKKLERLLWSVCLLGIANFLTFFLISSLLGGVAQPEGSVNGRYFLDKAHQTEVSRAVWTYSRVHAGSVNASITLAIIAGFGLVLMRTRTGDSPTKLKQLPMPSFSPRVWWFVGVAAGWIVAYVLLTALDLPGLAAVLGLLATAVAFLLYLCVQMRRCPQCGSWLHMRRVYPNRSASHYRVLGECGQCQIAWECGEGESKFSV